MDSSESNGTLHTIHFPWTINMTFGKFKDVCCRRWIEKRRKKSCCQFLKRFNRFYGINDARIIVLNLSVPIKCFWRISWATLTYGDFVQIWNTKVFRCFFKRINHVDEASTLFMLYAGASVCMWFVSWFPVCVCVFCACTCPPSAACQNERRSRRRRRKVWRLVAATGNK